MKFGKLKRQRTAAEVIAAAQTELHAIADAAFNEASSIEATVAALVERAQAARAEAGKASHAVRVLGE